VFRIAQYGCSVESTFIDYYHWITLFMPRTLVDTHCHYYPCYPISDFWDSAWQNFSRYGLQTTPILCLTDLKGTHWYSDIRSQAQADLVCHWQVEVGSDPASFTIGSGEKHIHVVSSRQINSKEGLEVLIIGLIEDIPSGMPIKHYIEEYAEQYAVILPWGFGKWLGKRGKIIEELLGDLKQKQVLLGDNGGRPTVWSSVTAFNGARAARIAIIPGSDPLPMSNQLSRVAALGIELDYDFTSASSLTDALNRALKTKGFDSRIYGDHRSLAGVVYDQFALRMP